MKNPVFVVKKLIKFKYMKLKYMLENKNYGSYKNSLEKLLKIASNE